MSGIEAASVYWDSCIFISWLKDEDIPGKAGIAGMVELIDAGEVELYVSTLVRVEVLTADLDAATRKMYDAVLRRKNVHSVDVGITVAEKARSLREFYKPDTPETFGRRQLGIADALHLATALIYEVDEFHTFDTRGRRDKDNTEDAKAIGLLQLDNSVAGTPLPICWPAPRQQTLSSWSLTNELSPPS